jgi:hypothetical protein
MREIPDVPEPDLGVEMPKQKQTPAAPQKESGDRQTITFDYVKSNYYRVVHVNGVVGSLTPTGDIHMGAWSQRGPYPQRVTHSITAEGELGQELDRETRQAIVREVEVGIVFSAGVALQVAEWLQGQVALLQEMAEKEIRDEQGDD